MDDMAKNQCDGCARGLSVHRGMHLLPNGNPVQTCEAGRYMDTKTHMISVNNRAVFVTLPAGERPTINGEDLYSIFGIQPGHCVKIG